jgi:hypothetical protein
MVQGGVLIPDGTVTLGIFEYVQTEPILVALLDSPHTGEIEQKTQHSALIEYVVYVIEVKVSGL